VNNLRPTVADLQPSFPKTSALSQRRVVVGESDVRRPPERYETNDQRF